MFPNLQKEMYIQMQDTGRMPSRYEQIRNHLQHILFK